MAQFHGYAIDGIFQSTATIHKQKDMSSMGAAVKFRDEHNQQHTFVIVVVQGDIAQCFVGWMPSTGWHKEFLEKVVIEDLGVARLEGYDVVMSGLQKPLLPGDMVKSTVAGPSNSNVSAPFMDHYGVVSVDGRHVIDKNPGVGVQKKELIPELWYPVHNGGFEAAERAERAFNDKSKDDYDLLFANCEHFARGCVEGHQGSRQVAGGFGGGGLGAVIGAGVGCGAGLAVGVTTVAA